MSIVKMFVTGSGVTAGVASIDVPAKGIIRAITAGITIIDTAPASGRIFTAELTFLSTAQYTTNDARGSLCQVAVASAFVDAARIAFVGTPFCVLTPISIQVNAGERIFLHAGPTVASGTINATAYLFIDDGIDVARPQTRRR